MTPFPVMAGLDPAICQQGRRHADSRVKPRHEDAEHRAVTIACATVAMLVWLWLCLAAAVAGDVPPVPVRVGIHPGFGRVVFDLPAPSDFHVTQDGQHVTIQFDNAGKIASLAGGTRNVLSITGSSGQAELVVAPGAVLRTSRFGNHVIIDVADPIGGATPPARAPPQAPKGTQAPAPTAPAPPQAKVPEQATPVPPPKAVE